MMPGGREASGRRSRANGRALAAQHSDRTGCWSDPDSVPALRADKISKKWRRVSMYWPDWEATRPH